jgi:alpha-beta hydrolase superfamily lysophospholipase
MRVAGERGPARLKEAMLTLPPIRRWDSVIDPRACVHIVHGMSEHGERYARLAGALNAAGFAVWAHDHRGHGVNPVPGLHGHFAANDAENGWKALVRDAGDVSAEMQRQFPGVPLFLFAHSMGSFAGQTLLADRPSLYRGVVLCGTNGPPGFQEGLVRTIARTQLLFGARRPGLVVSGLVFGDYNRRFRPARTNFDWLSRDAAEVDKYIADPLCGFSLTSQAWVEFLEGRTLLGTDAHLQRIPKTLPIHLIAGTHDPVGERSAGVQRLMSVWAKAGLTRVTHRFYADARHELVNEINRDEVTRDLIAWVDSVLNVPSTGSA